jgi:hypothetical protein
VRRNSRHQPLRLQGGVSGAGGKGGLQQLLLTANYQRCGDFGLRLSDGAWRTAICGNSLTDIRGEHRPCAIQGRSGRCRRTRVRSDRHIFLERRVAGLLWEQFEPFQKASDSPDKLLMQNRHQWNCERGAFRAMTVVNPPSHRTPSRLSPISQSRSSCTQRTARAPRPLFRSPGSRASPWCPAAAAPSRFPDEAWR